MRARPLLFTSGYGDLSDIFLILRPVGGAVASSLAVGHLAEAGSQIVKSPSSEVKRYIASLVI